MRLSLTTSRMDGEFGIFLVCESGNGLLEVERTRWVGLEGVVYGACGFDVDGSTRVDGVGGESNGGCRDHGDEERGSCAGNLGELHDG